MKLYKNLILILLVSITICFVGCEKDKEYFEPLPSMDRTSMVDSIIMKVNSRIGYIGNPNIKISTLFTNNVNNDYKNPETDILNGDTIGSILVEKSYMQFMDDNEVNKESLSYEQLRGPIWTILPLEDGRTLKQQWDAILNKVYYEGEDIRNYMSMAYDWEGYPTEPIQYLEGWEEILPWTETTIRCDHTKSLNIRAVFGTDKKMYSRRAEIRVKPEPQETYPEVTIPVIFHVTKVNAIGTYINSPEITTEKLQMQIDDLNEAISGKNQYPNSGKLNVTFALAKYDPNGVLLENEGIHDAPTVNVTRSKIDVYSNGEYLEQLKTTYFSTHKSKILWNPEQYLNIYIAPFLSTPDWPKNWLEGSEPLKGYETLDDPDHIRMMNRVGGLDDCPMETYTDYGILIGVNGYDRYTSQFTWNFFDDSYELMSTIGHYYGLGTVKEFSGYLRGYQLQIDDAQVSFSSTSEQFLKFNAANAWVAHNFMESASHTDNITVQQVHRIRETMINCPTRGAHKVPGALTGEMPN